MSCEKLLRQHLQERGLRFTPQRELILDALHQIETPATAEEIYERVHTISSSVDISTVYRTLELFQEFNLVSAFDLGDGIRRYEHLGVEAPHHHLICQTCGKVEAVAIDELQPLMHHLIEVYGFVPDANGLTIPGQCKACRTSIV
jgi:Fur family ferric uptake transcriptional regulator